MAIWKWVQKFGQRLAEGCRRPATDMPAVVLIDETAVSQRGKELTLFAALNSETRYLLHASVAPSINTFTNRQFLTEFAELYGRVPLSW